MISKKTKNWRSKFNSVELAIQIGKYRCVLLNETQRITQRKKKFQFHLLFNRSYLFNKFFVFSLASKNKDEKNNFFFLTKVNKYEFRFWFGIYSFYFIQKF